MIFLRDNNMAISKGNVHLHAGIGTDGKLQLITDDGRIVAGVMCLSVHTEYGDKSTADVSIILKNNDNFLISGKVQ